ncbi:MAG TPA: hypothetical protein VNP95_04975, partial [Thermomicrobiales bacterium]|nr:hypothetical protein [Thermomicrobiales bacterium]
MYQPSVSSVIEPATTTTTTEPATPATILHTVPSVQQLPGASAQERTVVLGGPHTLHQPAFSLGTRLRGRHVLVDTDLSPDELDELLDTAARIKRAYRTGQQHAYLSGKTLGLIFQHPSTRTRVSL